jgi:hypothetical protein
VHESTTSLGRSHSVTVVVPTILWFASSINKPESWADFIEAMSLSYSVTVFARVVNYHGISLLDTISLLDHYGSAFAGYFMLCQQHIRITVDDSISAHHVGDPECSLFIFGSQCSLY